MKAPAQIDVREVSNGNKKRKVSEGEDVSRKRSKAVVAPPSSFLDVDADLAEKDAIDSSLDALPAKEKTTETTTNPGQKNLGRRRNL